MPRLFLLGLVVGVNFVEVDFNFTICLEHHDEHDHFRYEENGDQIELRLLKKDQYCVREAVPSLPDRLVEFKLVVY